MQKPMQHEQLDLFAEGMREAARLAAGGFGGNHHVAEIAVAISGEGEHIGRTTLAEVAAVERGDAAVTDQCDAEMLRRNAGGTAERLQETAEGFEVDPNAALLVDDHG